MIGTHNRLSCLNPLLLAPLGPLGVLVPDTSRLLQLGLLRAMLALELLDPPRVPRPALLLPPEQLAQLLVALQQPRFLRGELLLLVLERLEELGRLLLLKQEEVDHAREDVPDPQDGRGREVARGEVVDRGEREHLVEGLGKHAEVHGLAVEGLLAGVVKVGVELGVGRADAVLRVQPEHARHPPLVDRLRAGGRGRLEVVDRDRAAVGLRDREKKGQRTGTM